MRPAGASSISRRPRESAIDILATIFEEYTYSVGERLWETDDAVRVALDNLVAELYDRKGNMRAMLERLDRNGTGTISRQEMQRGLTGMGIRLTPSEISAVMRMYEPRTLNPPASALNCLHVRPT